MSDERDDPGLDAAIAEYLAACDAGSPPERDAFLAKYPDLAVGLREFLADHDGLRRAARPADPAETLPLTNEPVRETLGTVRYFGDYELLIELARGGMGVVYKARQVSLNRVVALKMILAGRLAGSADVRRFQAEAEAAAGLDHPHVLPVYEVGQHQGQEYFAMKLVEGGSLASRLTEFVTSPKVGMELLIKVARAVHFAHQRGLLHRDLKPSNILLDPDGTPYVSDFGLAKRVDSDVGLTQTGAIVGTPSYMAPEQARAEKQLSTAIDVYSLGAILYELLTGRPPFRAATMLDTVLQVIEAEPVDPRKVNPSADRDLSVIALKCLRKSPAERYSSASTLADDLERWRRGEPILARPVGPAERTIKWVRRHPTLAALTAACLLVALAGVVSVSVMYLRAEGYRRDAVAERDRAKERLARQYAEKAADLADRGNPLHGLPWLVEAIKASQGRPTEELHRIHFATVLRSVPRLAFYSPTATAFAFHPDGRRIALADRDGVRLVPIDEGWDGSATFTHSGPVRGIRFSPDGRRMLLLGGRGTREWDTRYFLTARVWDLDTGTPVAPEAEIGRGKDGAQQVEFAGDGSLIAAVWRDPVNRHVVHADVRLYDATTLQPVGKPFVWGYGEGDHEDVQLDLKNLRALTLVRNVGGGELQFGRKAQVHDLRTGKPLFEPLPWLSKVPDGRFSPDGSRFVLANGNVARLHDSRTGKVLGKELRHSAEVNRVAYRPDGKRVATLTMLNEAFEWDATTGESINEFPIRIKGTNGWFYFNYSPDGRELIVEGNEGVFFDCNAPSYRFSMTHEEAIGGFRISPDGLHVAALEMEGVRIRSRVRGLDGLHLPHGGPVSATYSSDGRYLATSGNGVRVWDTATRPIQAESLFPPEVVSIIAVSSAGEHVASLDQDGRFQIVDARTGRPRAEPIRVPGTWREIVLSPDGKYVATIGWAEGGRPGPSADESARLVRTNSATWRTSRDVAVWHADTGRPAGPALRHQSVETVAFHSTEPQLFVANVYSVYSGKKEFEDGKTFTELRHWDFTTGQLKSPVQKYSGSLSIRHMHPDGRRLIVEASRPEGGNVVRTLNVADFQSSGPEFDRQLQVLFRRDGQRVLSLNTTLQVRDGSTGLPIGVEARHRSARLTDEPTILGAAFSTDGQRVASISSSDRGWNGEARIWHVETGEPASPLFRTTDKAVAVAFTSDDRILAVVGEGSVRMWAADSGMPVAAVRHGFDVRLRYGSDNPELTPRFLPGTRRLVVMNNTGAASVEFTADDRSIADLEAIAHVYAGHEIDSLGSFQALTESKAIAAAKRWGELSSPNRDDVILHNEQLAREAIAQQGRDSLIDAIRHLTACLKATPDRAWLYAAQADAAERMQSTEAAIADWGEVIRRDDGPTSRERRGLLLGSLGRYREAAIDLGAAWKFTKSAKHGSLAALALWLAGDRAAYRALCDELVALRDEFVDPVPAAEICALDPEGGARAAPFGPILERIVSADKWDSAAKRALAIVYARTNAGGRVPALYADLDLQPDLFQVVRLWLALGLWAEGKKDAAREMIKPFDSWFTGDGFIWTERERMIWLRQTIAKP